MTDTQDIGAIYSSYATHTTISNNNIHDCNVGYDCGSAIYNDGDTDNITMNNNLIHDMQLTGAGYYLSSFNLCGHYFDIHNNYIVNCKNVSKGSPAPPFSNGLVNCYENYNPNQYVNLQRNVFYSNSAGVIIAGDTWASNTTFQASDYNCYYKTNGSYTVDIAGVTTWSQWKALDGNKYDQHSIQADPSLMDFANKDYRLKYDSPAYNLGITDLDMWNMGLKDDFAFEDQNEALSAIFVKKSGDTTDKATISLTASGTAQLAVMGRTATGYVADLAGAAITYSSNAAGVATVNSGSISTPAETPFLTGIHSLAEIIVKPPRCVISARLIHNFTVIY